MCTTQRKFAHSCFKQRLHPRGCRLDLDQPWNLDNYFHGHITDSVNIVAWALDGVSVTP
jgi:hypothetical protein